MTTQYNKVLNMALEGDSEAVEELWAMMGKYVRSAKAQWKGLPLEPEDIESHCKIAFFKCLKKFDPDRGNTFVTLFTHSMETELKSVYRYLKVPKRTKYRTTSFDLNIGSSDDDGFSYESVVPSDDSLEEEYKEQRYVEQLMDIVDNTKYNDNTKKALKMIFEGKTVADVSEELECSRQLIYACVGRFSKRFDSEIRNILGGF